MRFSLFVSLALGLSSLYASEPLFPITKEKIFNASSCSQVVDKKLYIACYDYGYKSSTALGYTLDGALVGSVNIKHRPRFREETSIPRRYRSYYGDFAGHSIDRGHLLPDASADWDPYQLRLAYSLVNIVPQYAMVNRKMWSKAERYGRYIAKRLHSVNVLNLIRFSKNPTRIGRHHIAVPEGFYKIFYTGNGEAGAFRKCFYYENANYDKAYAKKDKLKHHEVACDTLYY